jgi:stage II sporulation protein AA (anti-sigma F factor antagonist)
MDLELKFTNKGSTLVIKMTGELDHHYSTHAGTRMDGEIIKATTKNVVFDLSGLSFMDSSGIGVIAGRYKNVAKLRGRSVIVSTNQQINRILEMAGIFKIIPCHKSVDDAVKELQA